MIVLFRPTGLNTRAFLVRIVRKDNDFIGSCDTNKVRCLSLYACTSVYDVHLEQSADEYESGSEYIPSGSVIEILARLLATSSTVANCGTWTSFKTRPMDSLRDSRSTCIYFMWMQESIRFISVAQIGQ